jgi:predicted ester cyclase
MDNIEVVKAYFAALDSADIDQIDRYLSEDYHLVDFVPQPMDKQARLEMLSLFKAALPNLTHSLNNIRVEQNVVKATVQLSGTNSGPLDLRKMGIGVVPRSRRFVIFNNANYEFTVQNGKITKELDVSPVSPNRRLPGMLKSLGVNVAAL